MTTFTFSAKMSLWVALLHLVALSYGEILNDFPYHMEPWSQAAPEINNEDTSHYGTGNCWTAASNTNGATVTLQKCTGAASQTWSFSAGATFDEGPGGTGTIKVFGNKCLDVTNGNNNSGTKMQIWTCGTANKNQQWQLTTIFNGLVNVHLANTTQCLDLTDGNKGTGTALQIWSCSQNNPNQIWAQQYAAPAPPSEDSTIWLRHHSALPSRRDLCVTAGRSNNSPVTMEYCDTAGNAIGWFWQGGSLQIFSEYCLDVTSGADKDGTKLQIYQCAKGNKNQQWKFNSNYSIEWVGHNKCIDLTDGKLSPGNQLQVYSCFIGNTNQQWDVVPVFTD